VDSSGGPYIRRGPTARHRNKRALEGGGHWLGLLDALWMYCKSLL